MLTKQQIGEAADALDEAYDFDRHPGYQTPDAERIRVLYNWLREQEKKPGDAAVVRVPGSIAIESRGGIPLDICDAKVVEGDVLRLRVIVPSVASATSPAQPTASQSPATDPEVAASPG